MTGEARVFHMKLTRFFFAPLLAAFLMPGSYGASGRAPQSWQLSSAQVHNLMRESTPESREKLARYFRSRANDYRNQAWQMDALLAQREVTAEHAGGKYAQSVDSSRRLCAYYLQMSQEMDSRAQFWNEKRQ